MSSNRDEHECDREAERERDEQEEPSEKEALLIQRVIPRFLNKQNPRRPLYLILGGAGAVFVALLILQWIVSPIDVREFRLPSIFSPKQLAPCSAVNRKDLGKLHAAKEFSTYIFADGRLVKDSDTVEPDTPICIFIAVPQKPLARYHDIPVPGKGPDNLHLLIKSPSVTLTFEPPRPFGTQVGLDEQFTERTILYFAEATLFDAGSYEVLVDREWSNWEWAHQWWHDLERNVTVYPTGIELEFPGDGTIPERNRQMGKRYPMKKVAVSAKHTYPKAINIGTSAMLQGSSNPILSRPLCSPNNTASSGRWYSKKAFASHIPSDMFDEWGYAWVGDTCRINYFNQMDLFECMKHRTIHGYGDSNLRRTFDTLWTAGGFCRDPSNICQGSDVKVPQMDVVADDPNDDNSPLRAYFGKDQAEFGRKVDASGSVQTFGRGSFAFQSFIESIAMNWEDWVRRFYDASDMKQHIDDEVLEERRRNSVIRFFGPAFDKDTILRAGAKIRAPPEARTDRPDLVMLQFGAWDESFTPTFDDFAKALPHFRDAVMEAYPPPTKILMKMSNGISCMETWDNYRRYSGTRIQHMHDITREVFRIGIDGNGPYHGLDGRMMVIDPLGMNGRCDSIRDYGEEFSNHQRFSLIRTEVQMILNAVCEKDPITKKVKWREEV